MDEREAAWPQGASRGVRCSSPSCDPCRVRAKRRSARQMRHRAKPFGHCQGLSASPSVPALFLVRNMESVSRA